MAQINTPAPYKERIVSLASFLQIDEDWQKLHASPSSSEGGFLSQLWYRGVDQQHASQVPGVYRKSFTDRAQKLSSHKGKSEDQRLHLEREILSQFRSAGAAFVNRNSLVEIYFAAQHFGMPTRLLDWSTNPLAALFFACDGGDGKDGVVYAMDARKIIPPMALKNKKERLYRSIMTMRNPFVEYAIGLSFWSDPKPDTNSFVLPVRPDTVPGRIGQQSSCFTLHMHQAPAVNNDTLITILVDARRKEEIREELHRLNINQFTTYYDLDHLSKEIKRSWGLHK
jgi:hypothetical protein